MQIIHDVVATIFIRNLFFPHLVPSFIFLSIFAFPNFFLPLIPFSLLIYDFIKFFSTIFELSFFAYFDKPFLFDSFHLSLPITNAFLLLFTQFSVFFSLHFLAINFLLSFFISFLLAFVRLFLPFLC